MPSLPFLFIHFIFSTFTQSVNISLNFETCLPTRQNSLLILHYSLMLTSIPYNRIPTTIPPIYPFLTNSVYFPNSKYTFYPFSPSICNNLDIQKAFDSIRLMGILYKCFLLQIPHHLIILKNNFYKKIISNNTFHFLRTFFAFLFFC